MKGLWAPREIYRDLRADGYDPFSAVALVVFIQSIVLMLGPLMETREVHDEG